MTPTRRTLYDLLDRADDGATLLIEESGRAWSAAELARASNGLALALAERGLRRGERVALWLHNGPEWIAALVACARLGAVAVSINTRFSGREVGPLIARTAAKALIFAPLGQRTPHAEVLAGVEAKTLASLRLLVAVGEAPPASPLAGVPMLAFADAAGHDGEPVTDGGPDDGCAVFTTSGTTSQPKLVLHGQERIVRHARDVAAAFGLARPEARALLAVPLCGVFGFSLAAAALVAACPLVVMRDFDASAAGALIRDHRVTNMVGTDDMLDRMLAAAPEQSPFPSLALYGHANFNPGLKDFAARVEARGVRLRGLFGMSETLALFAAQPTDAPLTRRALAGGVPVSPLARVRVADPATGQVLPDGEPGEVQFASPNLMLGYLDDPAATRLAFTPDGWFRTGDLGLTTGDGGFTHMTRMGDVLRIAGYLVNPREIEEVILADASVEACQAVEVTVPEGVRPVAFVVARPGLAPDEAALRAACRAGLAAFKVPLRIFQLPAFPAAEGANGSKVRRSELRALATELMAAGGDGAS